MKKKTTRTERPARKPAGGGIRKSELGPLRRTLLAKRDEILDTMRRNQELGAATHEVGDEADQAGLSIEKEILFELSDNERTTLDQVEGALRKMDKGTYGLCESCQKPIPRLRIKALPFARYCIECQNSAERATAS